MAKRLVESLSGIGAIHAGEQLLREARYDLAVWSEEPSDAAGDGPDIVPWIDGHIDIIGIEEAVVLAGPDTLTLTIDDGRRLAFHLTSTGGGIAARGWLR
jgi:hypothetical protein